MVVRLLFLNAVIVAIIAAPGTQVHAADVPRLPNIVLVITDDQGYGDLGCHGNPIVKTPHIDRFHAESVRFTDFHVSPTCAPTRSALMTGRHEFRNGVTHTINERERLTLTATTIAQVLQQAGYTNGIFGKWHLGDEAAYQPGRRGFDEVFIHGTGGIGQAFPGSSGDAPGNKYFDPAILHNGVFEKTHGYCTDVFFERAIDWIDRQRQRQHESQRPAPFFAYIATNAPHAPLDCPAEYEAKYSGQVPANVAKFYGMISNIDDNFGKLLARLQAWNLERNTLVIFMTDNGGTAGVQTFNAGMHGSKGTPYNGGTRVPAMWRYPAGFTGGRDVAQLTAHIDIFPTLAELAGVDLSAEVQRQVEGRSLMPLLRDAGQPWPDRMLVTHVGRWPQGKAGEAKFQHCSVRSTRYNMVNQGKRWELYDMTVDPGEKTDVAKLHPEIVQEMSTFYDQWWEATLPCLVNEDVVGPKYNPFAELYWKQFGGGPPDAGKSPTGAQ
jgi:arylsulfatase A-like enzyme